MPEHHPGKQKKPVVPTKVGYHHGDLRAQLLACVRELIEIHGPDGFSVAEAARLAGVSSAAPYKHFKDREDILRAVTAEAMDRLSQNMARGASQYAMGSIESVAAVGLAYVSFAKAEPGVFRLVFGLTEGHENAPDLLAKGENCFGVVVGATAQCLKLPIESPVVWSRAYMLWAFVHGHAFLTIDQKNKVASTTIDDWTYLMQVGRAVLTLAL